MKYVKLKREILDDPLNYGYAGTDDEGVLNILNTPSRQIVIEHYVNAKQILAVLGATTGAAFLDALETAAAANSAVRWAMEFIRTDSGIDVGNIETRAMLDQLAAAGILEQASVNKLKLLAERQISRAEEIGVGKVTLGDIQFVRRGA